MPTPATDAALQRKGRLLREDPLAGAATESGTQKFGSSNQNVTYTITVTG